MKKIIIVLMLLVMTVGMRAQQSMSDVEVSDRLQIRELVDRFAVYSDTGNQDHFADIFAKDMKFRIHMGERVREIVGVDAFTNMFKGAKADAFIHHIGQ